jgi:hypothetical protein
VDEGSSSVTNVGTVVITPGRRVVAAGLPAGGVKKTAPVVACVGSGIVATPGPEVPAVPEAAPPGSTLPTPWIMAVSTRGSATTRDASVTVDLR